MMNKKYDVFISYRRDNGSADARLIYNELKSLNHEVFLDVVTLGSGFFDERLFGYIEACDSLVLVLSPGALDKCWNEGDWVRREVECAYKAHKNIVPVKLKGFHFPEKLPDSLEFLRKLNYVEAHRVYFDAFIGLLNSFLQIPTPPVIQKDEISDKWKDILAAIDNGTIRKRCAVGDCIPLELGKFGVINMQLAGFELDDRADGMGKAPTTWIAKELLPETHAMYNDGKFWGKTGWANSDLRAWLRETVLPAFPDSLKSRLIGVAKRQEFFDGKWKDQTATTDRLWIPSFHEVFEKDSLYYGLFKDQYDKRVKTRNGSAAWWWLRSANLYYGFMYVTTTGSYYYASASYSGGVPLGFCL